MGSTTISNKKKIKKNKTLKYSSFSHSFSQNEKEKIVQELNPISIEDITESFEGLQTLNCLGAITASKKTNLGNDIVDKFTLIERLHTKGHTGIDFYTFWSNRKHFSKIGYVKKMLKFYESRDISEIRKWKYMFNLYFSSISIFRPIMAMEMYCRFPPKIAVLDPTMGWGGRLVGACALDLPKYIGIDSNPNLKIPYDKMVDFLKDKTTTKTELYFQDALTMDYSKLDYDMVLTSPPYYNIEIYRSKNNSNKNKKDKTNEEKERKKSKEEWNDTFYKPLFQTTYKYLKPNGHYCLNVSKEIYENVCVPLMGKAMHFIPLKKNQRVKSKANHYSEFIYVWQK